VTSDITAVKAAVDAAFRRRLAETGEPA